MPLIFKILKIPTFDLFDIFLPGDLHYSSMGHGFDVTLMPSVTGMVHFAMRYFRVNSYGTETELEVPPTDIGRYRASLHIEKGSDCAAAVLRIMYLPKS